MAGKHLLSAVRGALAAASGRCEIVHQDEAERHAAVAWSLPRNRSNNAGSGRCKRVEEENA